MRFFCIFLLFSLFFSFSSVSDSFAAPARTTKQNTVKKKTTQQTKKSSTGKQPPASSRTAGSGGKAKKATPQAGRTKQSAKKQSTSAAKKQKKGQTKKTRSSQRSRPERTQQVFQPTEDADDSRQEFSRAENAVPISVRGEGVNFERVIEACLYRDNQWMLPNETIVDVEDQLAHFAPTFVTGVVRFSAQEVPSSTVISSWNTLRARLQSMNSVVGMDITLDLQAYASPDAVTGHMQRIAKSLLAEAWTFDSISQVAKSNPEILKAAVAEAKLQGRYVGAVLYDASLPDGFDYAVVASGYEEGKEIKTEGSSLIGKVRDTASRQGKPDFPVLIVSGMGKVPGEGFVMGTTPAERRKLVLTVAKNQTKRAAFAYPVFGPVSRSGQSYDATRDEFMIDTVRRSMMRYNRLSNRSSIGPSAMDD